MITPDLSKFSSPASPLPVHELKVLQEYIHQQNLQIIGNVNPNRRKVIMLSQFFKSHKNQTVKVVWKSLEGTKEILAKTDAVGRDFVILTNLFTKYWIPFHAIESAEQPFEQVNLPHQQHQQVVYDSELKQKLLLRFGKTVAQKEFLKQQFFDQTLAGHVKLLLKNRVTIETNSLRQKGILVSVSSQGIEWTHNGSTSSALWKDVHSIEKQRFS
ncbi:hypothetical protein [Paenibacillus sp. Marseille-Q7038]